MNSEMKKILLVDDDMDYLFVTKSTIKNMGFEVVTAEGQKEAEEKIKEFRPDLAILDLMMENEDSGFILSYKLKKKYPDVPVIIATSVTAETGYTFDLSAPGEKQWIKADMYMDKGIRKDQLQREIRKLLKL
ncbi:MAG: response regulator [Bacteroidales bacterium]|nr:response regulator [Bacteroidales bacterium]MCF8343372.1 response regulator [Bacteroidales bacterium]MCF8350482.1 response regulator [Bacteroidales bacterium]MCF8375473.1 response regulator [Bacteroidales bacterium]MCF8399872.1 response regulator [Bacteroidales bacterium]